MFFTALTKNFTTYNLRHPSNKLSVGWYFFSILLFPLFTLVAARYFMLRRGRALNKISLEYKAATFLQKEVHHYLVDMIASIKIWDNKPILQVYFEDPAD